MKSKDKQHLFQLKEEESGFQLIVEIIIVDLKKIFPLVKHLFVHAWTDWEKHRTQDFEYEWWTRHCTICPKKESKYIIKLR